MIKLDVDSYCDNCPEFEAHVEKDTTHYEDFNLNDIRIMTNTIITCEHRERCRSIRKFLEKEKLYD